tara:strand:+ start:1250 stop:1375 length:126 start_codon:yes stop_codon:yes gene_type:complete
MLRVSFLIKSEKYCNEEISVVFIAMSLYSVVGVIIVLYKEL